MVIVIFAHRLFFVAIMDGISDVINLIVRATTQNYVLWLFGIQTLYVPH